MKKLFIIFTLGLILACEPENAIPAAPVNDMFDDTKTTWLRKSTWKGIGGYRVSSLAEIYGDNDKKVFLLNSFLSSSVPDLKVYLSATTNATSFINLGKLKSANGKQTSTIPVGTEIDQFKFSLIRCLQFSVLLGRADTVQKCV